MTTRTLSLLVVLLATLFPGGAFAQDDLQKAKDLYAAADYENALAILAAVPNGERSWQVGQYRAFCLIALGQNEQAEHAIQALLTADPLYVPDPAETSPRVLEAFTAARQRTLPVITRQRYLDAKAALERKEREAAISGFQALLGIIDGASDIASEFADLRILADGFLELSRALPEPRAALPTPDASSAPAPEPEAPPALSVSTPPVAVRQEMPPWVASDGVSRRTTFNGTLRIRVNEKGSVESAEMVRPVHPAYDGVLLRAAESWLYEPATEDGMPVPAEIIVQINLRPPPF